LQEGGSWDFLEMQLGPTSHGHVPNGEKNGSTKKNWQNKLGSHIFPKYLCSPPWGKHIGKLQGLKILKVAQWMNGHFIFIFHPYIFIHYTTSTFHLIKFSPFTLCHLHP
jgi:hypothetical protein